MLSVPGDMKSGRALTCCDIASLGMDEHVMGDVDLHGITPTAIHRAEEVVFRKAGQKASAFFKSPKLNFYCISNLLCPQNLFSMMLINIDEHNINKGEQGFYCSFGLD